MNLRHVHFLFYATLNFLKKRSRQATHVFPGRLTIKYIDKIMISNNIIDCFELDSEVSDVAHGLLVYFMINDWYMARIEIYIGKVLAQLHLCSYMSTCI